MKTDGRVRRRPEIYNDIANARAATDFVRPPTAGAARVPLRAVRQPRWLKNTRSKLRIAAGTSKSFWIIERTMMPSRWVEANNAA